LAILKAVVVARSEYRAEAQRRGGNQIKNSLSEFLRASAPPRDFLLFPEAGGTQTDPLPRLVEYCEGARIQTMFVALAVFEIAAKDDPYNPRVEGEKFKMRLADLRDFHESDQEIPDLMGYDDTVAKMLDHLPDFAMFAGQDKSLSRGTSEKPSRRDAA
jgi:hypothetical protein